MPDGLEAARRVEATGQLIGERFDVDDVVLTSRPDSRFVQTLRVQLASVDAGDLGTDERTAVLEILRAVLRPCDQQFVVSGQSFEMLPVAIGRPDAAARRTAERTIELASADSKNGVDVQSKRCAFSEASTADP